MNTLAVEAGILGGLKASHHIKEVLKKYPRASIVCGVEGKAIETDDPRLLRWLNSVGEVNLYSYVDPRLLESGE
jgi:hypothetical protein